MIKVFTITANGDDQNRQLAKQYGCDDYLTKPIDFDDLKKKNPWLIFAKKFRPTPTFSCFNCNSNGK
jgi:response regulator of citrate/malate metabolism